MNHLTLMKPAITLLVACGLMIFPLPQAWRWFAPQWITLVLVYWIFSNRAQSFGVASAWCIGLSLDAYTGLLLGQQALAMALSVYLAQLLRHRFRGASVGQQMVVIWILIGFYQLTVLGVQLVIGNPPKTVFYWASTFTSVALWPWINRLLNWYAARGASIE